jgi:hypothetical protein
MQLPKLDGQHTVPSGGYSVQVTEASPAAGPATVVVVAPGDHYLLEICASLAAALNADATLGGTDYAVTIDDNSETSTGRVTISVGGPRTFALVWTSTELRDLLGFTANLPGGASSYQSANASPKIWLPDRPRSVGQAPDGSDAWVVDGTTTVAPSGKRKRMAYAKRYWNTLGFDHVSRRKVWEDDETVVNESLESFYDNVFRPGYAFRYHPDRSVDGTYLAYFLDGESADSFAPERSINPQIDEWWNVRLRVGRHV